MVLNVYRSSALLTWTAMLHAPHKDPSRHFLGLFHPWGPEQGSSKAILGLPLPLFALPASATAMCFLQILFASLNFFVWL